MWSYDAIISLHCFSSWAVRAGSGRSWNAGPCSAAAQSTFPSPAGTCFPGNNSSETPGCSARGNCDLSNSKLNMPGTITISTCLFILSLTEVWISKVTRWSPGVDTQVCLGQVQGLMLCITVMGACLIMNRTQVFTRTGEEKREKMPVVCWLVC